MDVLLPLLRVWLAWIIFGIYHSAISAFLESHHFHKASNLPVYLLILNLCRFLILLTFHRKYIHKYIQESYWREALWELQQWEKWDLKYSNYSNHKRFTIRCISKGIVLVSLKLNPGRKDISNRAEQSFAGQKDSYFKKELEALAPLFWTMGVG